MKIRATNSPAYARQENMRQIALFVFIALAGTIFAQMWKGGPGGESGRRRQFAGELVRNAGWQLAAALG